MHLRADDYGHYFTDIVVISFPQIIEFADSTKIPRATAVLGISFPG
jgi:hypothetical protein